MIVACDAEDPVGGLGRGEHAFHALTVVIAETWGLESFECDEFVGSVRKARVLEEILQCSVTDSVPAADKDSVGRQVSPAGFLDVGGEKISGDEREFAGLSRFGIVWSPLDGDVVSSPSFLVQDLEVAPETGFEVDG